MSPFKRSMLWATLFAIVLLIGLSIYGAFLGAERAEAFFNSWPLAIYWFALIGLLVGGVFAFRRLLRVPSLLLMHAGCVLILVGAMWGSAAGHDVERRLFGVDKIRSGVMLILEGTADNRVMLTDSNSIVELPFSVGLADFRIDYYPIGTLYMQDAAGRSWSLQAEPGNEIDLGDVLGVVTVLKVFRNFRLDLVEDEPVAFDAPGDENPALQVRTTLPDGTETTRYVFENFTGHAASGELAMGYYRSVRDYVSEIDIMDDGLVVASKDIEVNHPLRYGGYHFYQQSYEEDQYGQYTILRVASDSGLNVVWIGYAALIAGLCWHFWGRRLWSVARRLQIAPSGGE